LLNFFLVNRDFYLVDLPGYGYAAVDRKTRSDWGPMVHDYLAGHPDLRVMLVLMDLRREARAEELNLMAWLEEQRLAFIPVLTKIDKLKPQARARKLKQWRVRLEQEGIGARPAPVSAHLKIGREELWLRIMPGLTGLGSGE
jgi:GTP-binding protein